MDSTFTSEALSSQGVELRVGDQPSDDTGPTSVTITTLSKTNPSTLVASSMTGLDTGLPVAFSGTSNADVDGKSFVLGAENASPASFDVTGLNGTGWVADIAAGKVTPVTWLNLCETKTFTGFDGQASEMDVTTLCSVAKEVRVGLQDYGNFNFTMNYVPSDPGTMEMQEAKAEGKPRWFQLDLPDDQGQWVFQAYVRQMTIAGGVDQPLTTNVVLRITGAPVFIPGAGAAGAAAAAANERAYAGRDREHERMAA